jgi:hypothetical protein
VECFGFCPLLLPLFFSPHTLELPVVDALRLREVDGELLLPVEVDVERRDGRIALRAARPDVSNDLRTCGDFCASRLPFLETVATASGAVD